MGRRLPVLFFVVVLAAFALGWRSGVFEPTLVEPARGPVTASGAGQQRQAALEPPIVDASPVAPVTPTPSEPGQTPAQGTPEPAAKPSFDVVRVEPDGSAVIAGRAEPGRSITVVNGDTVLGETRSGAGGEFVLDLTLPAGEHRLRLAQGDAADATAPSSLSDEAAIVNVPAKDRANELLVMMERPGQASEILVRPRPAEPQVAAVSPVEVPATPESPAAAVEPVTPSQPGTPAPAAAETTTAGGSTVAATGPERRLAVEAVEIENGRLFIAGSADPRSTIRIYLDDKLVTETRGGEGDRFIGSALAGVAVGDHVIRADEIGPDGQVVARAEVPFNRPDLGSMSAVAASGQPASEMERTASAPTSEAPAAPGGVAAPSAAEATSETTATADAAVTPAAEAGLRTSIQAPLATVQARVIIRRGDSLWRISRTTYGRGSRYSVIYLANGDQIRNPNRIYPGQVLKLPKDEAADGQG